MLIRQSNFTYLTRTKYGDMLYFKNDDPIGACLGYYGEWADQEFDVFSRLLTDTSNCIDVGANIGTHTLWLSSYCNNGYVFSVEPQHYIFQLLNANIILNDRLNAIPYKLAVSDVNEKIGVDVFSPNDIPRNYGEFKVEKNENSQVQIQCVKLDELDVFNKQIDFIKIDVEGQEADCIFSGEKMLEKSKPSMYIEFNAPLGNDDLLHVLTHYGYECFWHVYEKFNPFNYNQAPQNIWVTEDSIKTCDNIWRYYEGNLVAIHKDKKHGTINSLFTDLILKEQIKSGDTLTKYLLRNKLIAE